MVSDTLSGKKKKLRLDWIVLACLSSLSTIYYFSFYNYNLELLDEGYLLDPVMRVFRGEIPYKDFGHIYTPGRFYIFAGLFKIFGPNLLIVRGTWAVLHVVGTAFAFLAARRITNTFFSAFAAILVGIAPGPWHKTPYVVGIIFIIWLSFKYFENQSKRAGISTGLLLGGLFIFRQDVAVYGFLILIIFTAIQFVRKKELLVTGFFLSISFFFVLASFFFYFAANGALSASFSQIFFAGRQSSISINLPFPAIYPIWKGNWFNSLIIIFYYFPLVSYLLVLIVFITSFRKQEDYKIYLPILVLIGFFALLQLKYRPGLGHLWQVLPPAYICISFLLGFLYSKHGKRLFSLILSINFLIIFLFLSLNTKTSGSIALKKGNDTLLPLEVAKVYIPKEQADMLIRETEFITKNTLKESSILVLPDIPGLYFLTQRKNAVYYEVFLKGMYSSEMDQKKIMHQIIEKKTELIVYNNKEADDGLEERKFKNHSPNLYQFIFNSYKEVNKFGEHIILMKNQ